LSKEPESSADLANPRKRRRGGKEQVGKIGNWSKTVADSDYIEKLQNVIFQRHGCGSSWVESLPVHDVFRDRIIWDGKVEVFSLSGHPKARTAYAWIEQEERLLGAREVVETVLEIPPVDSPLSAVWASMTADFMRCL
jgi:hypothetical protein